jgi:putative flavoprotein involved in K+ transport
MRAGGRILQNAVEVVDLWVQKFSSALMQGDATVAALFEPSGIWRDFLSFTWNISTQSGRGAVQKMMAATREDVEARNWVRVGEPDADPGGWVGCWLRYEAKAGPCRAYVRIREGRAWTLMTCLTALTSCPWAEDRHRLRGYDYGGDWADLRQSKRNELGSTVQPDVVIVGGGQGGMGLGARLRSIGVSYLILDRHEGPGDSWRYRYDSLKLHDPVWYDHMPYIPFPADWPVYTPKDRMADWLEMYAKVMNLNYWSDAQALSAHRDGDVWSLVAKVGDEEKVLRPKHIVFATGMSGYPRIPDIQGAKTFEGKALHSSEFRNGSDFVGARAVIIGANTSAHDIGKDLVDKGATAVTMVQRSSTMIASAESVAELLLGPMYSEEALERGVTTDDADFAATTWPWELMPDRSRPVAEAMGKRDAALLERLRDQGFQLNRGDDGSGIPLKSARRGGGFYVEFGASEMICDGRISLASGVSVVEIEPESVVLSNGRRLECDLIIYATGYGPMNQFVADICGREVADTVGRVWGLGSNLDDDPGPWEGELRNMWKPTAVDGLWFHGGNLAQSRHYSRFLALQLKARLTGMGTPVYSRQTVHHKF